LPRNFSFKIKTSARALVFYGVASGAAANGT
jgi:hypothetical protein